MNTIEMQRELTERLLDPENPHVRYIVELIGLLVDDWWAEHLRAARLSDGSVNKHKIDELLNAAIGRKAAHIDAARIREEAHAKEK